jgi:hypothetical protein
MAASKPYTPRARIWRALAFADLLDAAGIASISVEAMDSAEWAGLATAAGVRAPSPDTRDLTISMLRNRENVRRKLQPLVQNRRNHATSETTTAPRAEY